MIERLRTLGQSLAGREIVVLVAVLAVAGGVWAFVELADEVVEGATQAFDEWVLGRLRRADDPAMPIGPAWLRTVMRDITALGGVAVLTLITLAVVCFLLIRRRYRVVVLIVGAVSGGILLSNVLKYAFARPRPEAVEHLTAVYDPSFPSGHSMLSAVVYLTLGALLARLIGDWPGRLYILLVAVLFTILVGVSRIYLGVHYPTDVLAGWTAGLVWAVFCWLVAFYLQRRGTVDRSIGARSNP